MKKLVPFIVLCMFLSCTKTGIYECDSSKPEIKVAYPTDNPVIAAGDPLCMKVLITDNKGLMNVWFEVNDGSRFRKEFVVTGRSIEIVEKYTVPTGVKGNLVAKFFAVDGSGNMNSAEIKFAINN